MQLNRPYSCPETGNTSLRLVLFSTSWSIPCRQQWEILEKFCMARGNDMDITKIDIDCSPEFADRWTIQSIPTMLLLRGNREIDRFVGLLSTDRLQAILDNHMQMACKAGH